MPDIKKIRDASFRDQNGRCYYCRQPMWRTDPAAFAKTHALSPALACRLQATAEHLTPKRDGGDDGKANIVAACLYCNTRRHRARTTLRPDEYMRKVQSRIASNRWHMMSLGGP